MVGFCPASILMKGAMKKLFLASFAGPLLAAGGSAQATDIAGPVYKAPPPPPRVVACPTRKRTRVYHGLNRGRRISVRDTEAPNSSPDPVLLPHDTPALTHWSRR